STALSTAATRATARATSQERFFTRSSSYFAAGARPPTSGRPGCPAWLDPLSRGCYAAAVARSNSGHEVFLRLRVEHVQLVRWDGEVDLVAGGDFLVGRDERDDLLALRLRVD